MRFKTTIVLGGIVLVGAGAALAAYQYRHDISRSLERASLPEAVEYAQPAATPATLPGGDTAVDKAEVVRTPTASPARTAALPAEVNLAVPFTSQAPHAIWDLPYKEFCEEASVLMAMRYIQKRPITSPADADAALLDIKTFTDGKGYPVDTTAAETATMITEHYDYASVALVENPTADDIRAAVAAGKPVIMPAAGRLLGNPYFQTPGPLYHMIVIKGYTADGRFIVNDPGTRRGADFIYSEATIMNAMHDWRADENIEQGRKVVIVVG